MNKKIVIISGGELEEEFVLSILEKEDVYKRQLHGSSQEKRKKLMPVANKYELSDVLDACDYYFDKTGRRITFEYSLVAGVNDQPDDIRELTAILKRRNCHLNLIPVNPIKERDFKKPDRKNALEFKNKLEKNGINVTIRRERGSDIDGACGQPVSYTHLEDEVRDTRKVLTAAALTYVAGAASAILQLLRILLLTGNRRND